MSKVVLTNMKDIENKLSYGLALNEGDIVLIEDEYQVSDNIEDNIKRKLLMLVYKTKSRESGQVYQVYTELFGIGEYNRITFDRGLFTNHKYKDISGFHTVSIIGKCDINIKIDNISSYRL